MKYIPAPPLDSGHALFLDLDGTMLEHADNPASISADNSLTDLLSHLFERLDGALAIVSGRPILDLDRILSPLRLPSAGLHGLEWRSATTAGTVGASVQPLIALARTRLRAALQDEPNILLEDKGIALAIHFRLAPEKRQQVLDLAAKTLAQIGPALRLQLGASVVELLPQAATKGSAVREFMSWAPFSGRQPVFVGDDLTDLDGFQAARQLGGFGVAVGSRVAAEYVLQDTQAVHRWLLQGVRKRGHRASGEATADATRARTTGNNRSD